MSIMLLSVTTKNTVLCSKLCPKFLLGSIRRLYSLGSIKYTPLPPFPPSTPPPLISTTNKVKLARNKRHTEVQKITFLSWSISKTASKKSRLLICLTILGLQNFSCKTVIFKTFIHYAGLMLDALTVALFSKSYQYNSTLVLRQLVAILSVLCAVMNVLWSVLL